MIAIHALRVNVKSLSAESRAIRHEIRKVRSCRVRELLHHHRVTRVKPEARLAHLALAFVRGVPYRTVERDAHTQVPAYRIARKLQRFFPEGQSPTDVDVLRWILESNED